jgi:hypothetical protein
LNPEGQAMLWLEFDEQNRPLLTDRARYEEDDMLACAYRGDTEKVVAALAGGAAIDMVDAPTGLCALHIAVGTNNLTLARLLVEQYGARFFPDRAGRWPSLIAVECDVDEELADYITETEARFLEQERSA